MIYNAFQTYKMDEPEVKQADMLVSIAHIDLPESFIKSEPFVDPTEYLAIEESLIKSEDATEQTENTSIDGTIVKSEACVAPTENITIDEAYFDLEGPLIKSEDDSEYLEVSENIKKGCVPLLRDWPELSDEVSVIMA